MKLLITSIKLMVALSLVIGILPQNTEFVNTTLQDSVMRYIYRNRVRNESVLLVQQEFIHGAIKFRLAGICYTEVPSHLLLCNKTLIRVGDGVGKRSGHVLVYIIFIHYSSAFFLQSAPNLTAIQVCCDGYERNSFEIRKCDPICLGGCRNGEQCIAPNLCMCPHKYVRNSSGYCVPTCPIGELC